MKNLFLSLIFITLGFASAVQAKNKYSNNPAPAERNTSSTSSFLAGGYNEHEVTTFLSRGLFASEKACKDCNSGTTIDLGASYLHYLKDGWQVGGEGRLQSISKEASAINKSVTLIDLVGIGAYNFQSDLKNSFFAKAGIGIYSVLKDSRDDYENKIGFFVGAGKRFALWSNVSYTPEARLIKKGDIDFGIEIALANFSIIW